MPPRKFLPLIIFLAFLGTVLAYVLYDLTPIRNDMTDFQVCFQGGKRILAGETLYRPSDGHLQNKYSPFSAVLFSLFTVVPYETAKILWYYLEWIFLAGAFYLSLRLLPVRNKSAIFLIGFSLLILAKFIGREFELGQINTLIIFLLTFSLGRSLAGEEAKGGLAYGFSLFFKPYALIFLPYFLLKKKFKLVAVGVVTLLFGLWLPAAFYGFRGNLLVLKEWVSTLSSSTPALLTAGDNASLWALIFKHVNGGTGILDELLILLVFLLLAFAFLKMMKTGRAANLDKPEVLEASFLFILIPFLSPLGWYYNYLYAVPAIMLLLNSFDRFQPVWKSILIADFLIIGGSLREVLGKEIFRFYTHQSLVVINFLVLVFFLFYGRAKKYF